MLLYIDKLDETSLDKPMNKYEVYQQMIKLQKSHSPIDEIQLSYT